MLLRAALIPLRAAVGLERGLKIHRSERVGGIMVLDAFRRVGARADFDAVLCNAFEVRTASAQRVNIIGLASGDHQGRCAQHKKRVFLYNHLRAPKNLTGRGEPRNSHIPLGINRFAFYYKTTPLAHPDCAFGDEML